MAIEIPQNKEISIEGKDEGRKGVGSAIRRRTENRGSINIKNESDKELLREILTPT